MSAVFPGAVSTQAQLRVLVNNLGTLLNGDHTSGVTTITVDDTTGWPTSGYGTMDSEVFSYTGLTATTFTGVTRGVDGTTAVAHNDNTVVNHYFVADHHNHMADEIIGIEQNLSDRIGLGSTQLKVPNGSAAAPSVAFANSTTTGFFRSSADTIGMATTGIETGRFAYLSYAFGDSLSAWTASAYLQFRTSSSAGSVNTNIAVVNDNNTGAFTANAFFVAQVAGGTTLGDPHIRFIVSGVNTWCVGVDNSASDQFVISKNATPGTNDYFTINTSGQVGIGGTASWLLQVMSSVTLIPTTGDGQIAVTNTSATATDCAAIIFLSQTNRRAQITAGKGVNSNDGFLAFSTRENAGGTFPERMRIDESGKVMIGTTSPISTLGGLDIASGGLTLIMGANNNAQSSRTDATTKAARVGVAHYTNAEEPMAIFSLASSSTDNELDIGGGTATLNASTKIVFYAAANTTTTTGTEMMRIDSSGVSIFGATPAANQLLISKSAAAATILVNIVNSDNTDPNSIAAVRLSTGGGSAGDPYVRFDISGGGASWSAGVDNSDSDKFKIHNASTIATSSLLTFDSSGNLTTTGAHGAGVTSTSARFHASDATDIIQILESSWANSSGASLNLRHTRGSGGAHTVLVSGDALRVRFQGSDGAAFRTIAEIVAAVDGTPGSSDMPGKLSFYTTPDGTATSTERVKIDNAGVSTFLTASTTAIYLLSSFVGDYVGAQIENSDNTNAASGARLLIKSGGTSAGDPQVRFRVGTTTDFVIGLDNSDSDKFKISASATLGTTDVLSIDTSGNAVFTSDITTAATKKLYLDGGGDSYLSEISANVMGITAGATTPLVVGASYVAVTATHKLYLDGGGDTYVIETSANVMNFFTNNAQRLSLTAAGSLVPGTGALATNATDGFIYMESCAGTPTGVPTGFTGRVALVYDSTNNKIAVYNGAWKQTAALT